MFLKNFFGEIEGFQAAASPIMEGITDLHNGVMFYLIMILSLMSLILLVNICYVSCFMYVLINIEWTLFFIIKKNEHY